MLRLVAAKRHQDNIIAIFIVLTVDYAVDEYAHMQQASSHGQQSFDTFFSSC